MESEEKPVRSLPWKGSSMSETRERAAPSHSGVWYLLHKEERTAGTWLHETGTGQEAEDRRINLS